MIDEQKEEVYMDRIRLLYLLYSTEYIKQKDIFVVIEHYSDGELQSYRFQI